MASLLTRLSGEHRKLLDEHGKQYPCTAQNITDNLNSVESARNVKFGIALDLWWIIYPSKNFDVVDYYKLFEDIDINQTRLFKQ